MINWPDVERAGAVARDGTARLGGGLLAAATALIAKARTAAKPLHPRGEVWTARFAPAPDLSRHPDVVWLTDVMTDRVELRVSTAIGLRPGWPDVAGIALRFSLADRPVGGRHVALRRADLLLASTGTGPLTRFLLAPTRHPDQHRLTTLLPYRGTAHPVVFALSPQPSGTVGAAPDYEFAVAHGTGPWRLCGRLRLGERVQRELDFDPIGNLPPGLDQYSWVRLLRSPAYRTARRRHAE
ncbi:hypothetical protein ACLM5J_03905 [Nocardioides sp. Bht2]|uniref:hypothetical protein n=1 Tax=Nocardioides sp. Bht2 TaxID=3392297 RepID=UPI0039B65300